MVHRGLFGGTQGSDKTIEKNDNVYWITGQAVELGMEVETELRKSDGNAGWGG